jgi:Ca2+-binding RTX toxin-like protein
VTGSFSGTAQRVDVGAYLVRVTATDAAGVSIFDDFLITVDAVAGQVLVGTSGDDALLGDAGDDTLAGRQGAVVLAAERATTPSSTRATRSGAARTVASTWAARVRPGPANR